MHKKSPLRPTKYAFYMLCTLLLLTSCKGISKFVQPDEKVLSRNHYKITMQDSTKVPPEVKEALSGKASYTRQKPNSRLLGITRFKMKLYCLSTPGDTNFIQRYLRRQGQAPVIYNPNAAIQTAQQLEGLLATRGCFVSTVTFDTLHRKRYDTEVTYTIKATPRYKISDVSFHSDDHTINKLLQEWQSESLIRVGEYYDQSNLSNERTRIVEQLRNNGYYYASNDLITYQIDTTIDYNKLSIRLQLHNPTVTNTNGQKITIPLRQYRIDNIYIYPNSTASSGLGSPASQIDTLRTSFSFRNRTTDYQFVYSQPMTIRPKVITRSLFQFHGMLFRANSIERSYNSLLNLKNFKYINIEFVESPNSTDSLPLLDTRIRLLNAKRQRISASIELNNSSPFGSQSSQIQDFATGNLGLETKLDYQNKNLFGGAEILTAEWSLLLELPKLFFSKKNQSTLKNNVNSFENGLDLSLDLPTFLFPFHGDILWQRMRPHTLFSLGANYQYRSYFERMLLNTGFGYTWNRGQNSHQLLPFELTYVRFFNIDQAFLERLGNLSDARLKYQYSNHFIFDARYDYVHNTQQYNTRKDFDYIHLSIESAGNLLYGISSLLNTPRDSNNTYQLLGVPFSQYVRFNTEYKHYFYLGKSTTLVARIMLGLGLPYLNSSVMPYEKSFYGGGPTTIRAWHLRHLGPGSYTNSENNMLERVGDMQLVVNIESRFPIFSIFEGALFVDLGNVWLYHDSEEYPGGQFKLKELPQSIACGIGAGLRANISILTLRLDLAIPLYNPGEAEGLRWRPAHWKFNQLTANFGIDYPF